MLSENVIRFSRPVTRKQKLFDEKGLYLLLTPRGSRLWRFKYRFPPRVPANKEKCISLGAYPEVSLERARKRRDAARVDVANGTDPSLRRVCETICRGNTFEAVAREFLSVLRCRHQCRKSLACCCGSDSADSEAVALPSSSHPRTHQQVYG